MLGGAGADGFACVSCCLNGCVLLRCCCWLLLSGCGVDLQVVADRERKVLSHVINEAVERLAELARAGEAHRQSVRSELDGLQLASGGVAERVDQLDVRLDHVQGTVGGYEGRLTVVEGIAAGLVPLLPTGEELCQLCMAFEDKVMRTATAATAVTLTSAGLPAVHLNMVIDDETSQQLTRFAVRLAEHVARTADQEVLCGGVREPKAPPAGSGPLWTGAGRQLTSKDSHNHNHSHTSGSGNSSSSGGRGGDPYQTLLATVALYDNKGGNTPWGTTDPKGTNNLWGNTASATATASFAVGGGVGMGGGGGMGVGGLTVEEEVGARRDALVRAFEASFVQALRRCSGHTNVSAWVGGGRVYTPCFLFLFFFVFLLITNLTSLFHIR